jgi:Zn-dependent protease
MLGLDPVTLIARLIVLVIAFTFHELAHAWSADQLGDDTARRMGRLTLNPLAHLDPLGSLLLLFAGFGWAKPVPVNPYRLRPNPQVGFALVAAAGPFSNLVMALIAAIPFRFGVFTQPTFLANLFFEFIYINIILMLFNLLPIAPLDGSKILRGFAPREWDRWLAPLEQYGPFILMGVLVLGRFGNFSILDAVIGPPTRWLLSAMLGG